MCTTTGCFASSNRMMVANVCRSFERGLGCKSMLGSFTTGATRNRRGDIRNRSHGAYNGLYRSGESCHRLFRTGRSPQYVAMRAGRSTSTLDASDREEEHVDALVTQCKASINEARPIYAVEDDSNRLVPNAWSAFAGWSGHLSELKVQEQVKSCIQRAVMVTIVQKETLVWKMHVAVLHV